jgi:hypothetical protein
LSYAAGVGNGDGAFLGPVRVTLQHFVPGIDSDKPTPPVLFGTTRASLAGTFF